MDDYSNMRPAVENARILVISVHPDDETLGCGGVILKHRAQGAELHWLIVTAPAPTEYAPEFISAAAAQVEQVAAAYGMARYWRLNLPTARLDTIPQAEVMTRLREVIERVHPDTVYLVHAGDVHTDHHAVFNATLGVLKPFHMAKWDVRRILSYETLSSTDAAPPQLHRAFVPNVFADISPYLESKIEIMRLYETEAQSDLLPRGASALRSLARVRGATVGVEYAEAFMLLRELA